MHTCLCTLISQGAERRRGMVRQLRGTFALVSKFWERRFLKLNVHRLPLSYIRSARNEKV